MEKKKNPSFVLPGSSTFLDFFFFFLGGSSGGNIYRVGDSSVAPIMTDENVCWVSILWDRMAWIVLFPMAWLYFSDGVECTFPMAWLYFPDGVDCTFPMAWSIKSDQSRCRRTILGNER